MLLLLIILVIIILLLCIIKKKSTNESWENIQENGIVTFMNTIFANEGIEYIVLGKSMLEMMFEKKPSLQVVIKNEDMDTFLDAVTDTGGVLIVTDVGDDTFEIQMKGGEDFVYIVKVHPDVESSKKDVNVVTDEFVDNLYDLTKLMDYFLKKHNIPYWLIGGSLIGALRNTPGGPIKWDDDVDVAIIKKYKKKLLKMMKHDEEFKSRIEYKFHNWGYQYRLKGDTSKVKKYYYDVFIYEKKKGKYGTKWYTSGYPKSHYHHLKEIFPLRECNFWDLILPCPNNLSTVHRGYKDNVLTHGFRYNHKRINSELVNLWECVNNGDTVPMLSKNLAKKLCFK